MKDIIWRHNGSEWVNVVTYCDHCWPHVTMITMTLFDCDYSWFDCPSRCSLFTCSLLIASSRYQLPVMFKEFYSCGVDYSCKGRNSQQVWPRYAEVPPPGAGYSTPPRPPATGPGQALSPVKTQCMVTHTHTQRPKCEHYYKSSICEDKHLSPSLFSFPFF